jgi:PIN domain nuclease of toxin-antitoxin system
VILLDTNALIWLEQGRPRTRTLAKSGQRLYISPANLLELEFLLEAGKIRLKRGTVRTLADDSRWALDDPPAGAWFSEAIDLGWTRDPFDRLLVAHARPRAWRLASSDGPLQDRLHERERLRI